MKALADDAMTNGSNNYDKWLAEYERLRVSAARMINASPREIATVKNTSEGIATVALGIDWKSGDRIVAFNEEFPANYFPWKRLESRGVQIEWLNANDPLERIEQTVRGARLLTISYVQYLSGFRADLNAIGAICERHGCCFFVDAIQGLGVFPLDVEAAKISALSADGHKWLLGPEGCGILYVRQSWQDAIEPVEFGWTNVARYADYASRDMTLRSDAGRYECGTLNTIGIFGLRASIDFLLEVGIEQISRAVQRNADILAEGAVAKGYEVLGNRTPETGAGIVSIRKQGIESPYVVRQLKDKKMIGAPRQGWIRLSPHFYASGDEMMEVVEALP